MGKNILLVEPGFKNKYPPLGLMKISTYHKLQGDYVRFVKGCSHQVRIQKWDRIYISTLFTFFWAETMKTIRYYLDSVKSQKDIIVGGIMATLLGDEIESESNVTVIRGLLDKAGILDSNCRYIIDHLVPDYRLLDDIDYEYGIKNAYLSYATRGCPNSCRFCAVKQLEPNFIHYLPLKKQIRGIEEVYGPKQDLLLLDNNVLASNSFNQIVHDIISLGFEKGSLFNRRLRHVDFNQGMDVRNLTRAKVKLLAKTSINPLRLAFDNIKMKDKYIKSVRLTYEYGLLHHSTYVLFNYMDTPKDFYERLMINIQLNEELGMKISSFPMKYIPLDAKDRKYIGPHWNRKIIRGVQCILLATRGMVSPRRDFFEAAFGKSFDDFMRIVLMPERYIIYRNMHAMNGAYDWSKLYNALGKAQKKDFMKIISSNKISKEQISTQSSIRMRRLLDHYLINSR